MLETAVTLTHDRCVIEQEYRFNDRAFAGHGSVTELEVCWELREWHDFSDLQEDLSFQAAADAERAAERALENQWDDPDEGLLTAGGVLALYDPQVY